MSMDEKEIAVLLAVAILLLLATVIIILFFVFSRKKNSLLEEKNKELAKAQFEIREETLRNISWELHDNIGQLLTLAKINAQLAFSDPSKIESVITSLDSSLKELRALSRVINPSFIKNLSLVGAIELEVQRYNRLEFLKTNFELVGEVPKFDEGKEIILFRIVQEFFTNSIKHSKATKLNVYLVFDNREMDLTISDNGIGYLVSDVVEGIGIKSMRSRAELIGARIILNSIPSEGTKLMLKYNY